MKKCFRGNLPSRRHRNDDDMSGRPLQMAKDGSSTAPSAHRENSMAREEERTRSSLVIKQTGGAMETQISSFL